MEMAPKMFLLPTVPGGHVLPTPGVMTKKYRTRNPMKECTCLAKGEC